MSRSGYVYDWDDHWGMIRWRGAVAQAVRGRRGQQLLRDLAAALDAMPEKRLIANDLVDANGCHCALGVLGETRQMDLAALEPEDTQQVANAFGVADALIREIVYINDEGQFRWDGERYLDANDPLVCERRWKEVRDWVQQRIEGADAQAVAA
ncbi:MAG: hypothetical protein KDI48_02125 [Xanthomonadales bacterium]|nr:hypothetical protein [Xanthomonadales bacterium]